MVYEEAYILVKHLGFSYADVKTMTRQEREIFLKLYKKESDIIAENHEKAMKRT